MELQTVNFLRNGGTLAQLGERFGITPRRHGRYPNLLLLKYSQINSPMAEPIVQECRGLILDEADQWRVVSAPYFKFFNYGEPNAAKIDWTTARVYEKLDGSLMTLYHYRDEWHVASSGTPDAQGPAGFGQTFSSLFWQTWKELGYQFPDDEETCFMFELMTPWNRVVVPHSTSRLILHGARNRATLAEQDPVPIAAACGWQVVRAFPLDTIDGVIASCAVINPLECEGYIVVDSYFNRIKVKSPQYVALAHMKECMSGRRMLEIVRTNEGSEFLTHFPEYAPLHDEIRGRFEALVAELEAAYAEAAHVADQKEFARRATQCRFSSPLFAVRSGKASSIREFLAFATQQSVERALGIDLTQCMVEGVSIPDAG